MWDTSGSTNFDSVRPLSYSEVVWEASCSALTDLVHFHRLLPEMPTDNISISRRIFSLFASALLSPSPSTMSEITGLLRWRRKWWDEIRLLKSAISVRWWTLLYKHNLTYIGFCQQVGKHSAAPLLLCGCQSDLRWENLPELNNCGFCSNRILHYFPMCVS